MKHATCQHCGKELKRKSNNGRYPKYCNSVCRVRAWREKQKAKSNGFTIDAPVG